MFLEKYVDDFYMDLIYDTYKKEYLASLDEKNFLKIYKLLVDSGFYFINDVILNYLELFEMDELSVSKALDEVKKILGDDYVYKIGNDLTYIGKIIDRVGSL